MEHRAKKRFGQHFLHEKAIVERIIGTAGVQAGDKVLEIGPGLGALTRQLVPKDIQLQLVELDRDMVAHIHSTWPEVALHEADACHVDWSTFLTGSGWKCISNLPYNVGTGIVTDLITCPERLSSLTVMLQLEVAQRMVAPLGDRKRGSLSAFMSFFCTAEIAFKVPKGAFSPPPKVESAVLQIEVLPNPHVPIVKKQQLEQLLSVAFSHPRKTVKNCLQSGYNKDLVGLIFSQTGVDPQKRPAHLTREEISNMLDVLSAYR